MSRSRAWRSRSLPTARSSPAGPGQFAGYWQNPAATAAAIDADGWYHTGDLGTLSADGLLSFRGRKKDMIALPDGQKVYPEDVETALRLDERIRDATVVAWPPGPNLRVHAVLLMDDGAAADAVLRAANERLAPHQHIRGTTVWPEPGPAADPHAQGPEARGARPARGHACR